jgi:uncharacterized Tic20 family protein
MLCHIAGLCGFVIPAIGCVIGPLIVWQMKKDLHLFVDINGKKAINFQVSMLIYLAIAILIYLMLSIRVLMMAVVIVDVVLVIIAAVKAANGETYRYPLSIRFIK